MAGKIIADIIEAPYDSIKMNVGNVTVLTANSSGLNYIPTGNVNINIGGPTANLTMNLLTANGIKFPATQVSSGDANTLDDYEEGSWTPSLGGNTTYSTQIGRYIKIGQLVTVTFDIVVSSIGTGSTRVINNIPFTVLSGASYAGGIGYYEAAATALDALYIRVDAGLTNLVLDGNAGAVNTITGSAIFQNGTRVIGSVTYRASA